MAFEEPTWLDEAIKKYRRKLDHVKLRPQLSALLSRAQDNAAISAAMMDRLMKKVRAILDVEGVLSDFATSYYDYALALDKAQRTLPFQVDWLRQWDILKSRWTTRGLDLAVLAQIEAVVIWRK